MGNDAKLEWTYEDVTPDAAHAWAAAAGEAGDEDEWAIARRAAGGNVIARQYIARRVREIAWAHPEPDDDAPYIVRCASSDGTTRVTFTGTTARGVLLRAAWRLVPGCALDPNIEFHTDAAHPSIVRVYERMKGGGLSKIGAMRVDPDDMREGAEYAAT
jgi:hypothetical protein